MNIYLIKHEEWGYDCYDSLIIVANNDNEVRELAKKAHADEGEDIWGTAAITLEGEYRGSQTSPFILHKSFNAG